MDSDAQHFDLVVVGGGPAGVTAALRARELGATVALLERASLGGTCTNDGCVPTRVLAHAARLRRDAGQFAAYGLIGEVPEVDFVRLLQRTHSMVHKIHEKKQLQNHLAAAGVQVYTTESDARFRDPHTLRAEQGPAVSGDKILLCVGGRPRRLTFPGSEHALTHSDVWSMNALPASLAIVGGAATGCQLASVFAAFGSSVTLLEMAPRLVPGEDARVSEMLARAFQDQGIEIVTGIGGVDGIAQDGGNYRVTYRVNDQPQEQTVGAVLLATGWPGNADTLNLEAAGVHSERSYIVVNDALQTNVSHIYAAGDITGRMMLVQSASGEGSVAAENAVLGSSRGYVHHIVPHGSFTDPEYASVGLTEAQAREQESCVVAEVPYTDLDRAVIDGHRDGFCKLIASADGSRVLGAHVVGEQAVEVVQIIAAGMAAGTPVARLADLELSYPTYTAIVGLAARQIMRDAGLVPVAAQWRAVGGRGVAQWEGGMVEAAPEPGAT
ncbi:MAG TPA: NAD(P)/FAD-dependent oxidoreductase [Chloroflexia bacterium]|nr:NAD(P)/FAD-dependent oxidoreductase [Chloroflexia bacterium]